METVNPFRSRGPLRWGVWLSSVASFLLGMMVVPTLGSAGCTVSFRHGEMVRADRCEDQGEAVAYVRFGGWVVVPKAALVSVADETGVTRFSAPWTPAEMRAQVQALPREGGVPIGPTGAAMTLSLATPPPQVVYVPVPVSEPPQPVYEVASPAYGYAYPVGLCRHCSRRHPGSPRHPIVRGAPANPSPTGPMAIQQSLPPTSRMR